MKLSTEFLSKISAHVAAGNIDMKISPCGKLALFDYSRNAQIENIWDEATLSCRGLVIDVKSHKVVAYPFSKFFNESQHDNHELFGKIPMNENYEVFDKADGSLGIAYFYDGKWRMNTRGSFSSEQAIKGLSMLNSKSREAINSLDINTTYLFEIIYPENRVVVDYDGLEDLVMLGAFNIEGEEAIELSYDELIDNHSFYFTLVQRYDHDVAALSNIERDNKEGFVVRFDNGFRMKVKHEEYVRLHALLSNLSTKTIWKALADGIDVNTFMSEIPDEVDEKVKSYIDELITKYDEIFYNALDVFNEICVDIDISNDKEFALRAMGTAYPFMMFRFKQHGTKYDNKINKIWKLVKPETTMIW